MNVNKPTPSLLPVAGRSAFGWVLLLLLLAVALMLAGCTQIPLGSLWALRKFDFERFDPAQLRAAVYLPPGLQFPAEALVIDLKLTRGATGEVLHERLPMRPSAQPPVGEHWPSTMRRPGQWVLLKLDDTAQARIAALRERAGLWKVADNGQGKKNNLELGVQPALCRSGAGAGEPSEAWRTSLWLRWSAEPGYVVLLDDKAVRDVWPELPSPLPACQPV
jgi:hypothetical protein